MAKLNPLVLMTAVGTRVRQARVTFNAGNGTQILVDRRFSISETSTLAAQAHHSCVFSFQPDTLSAGLDCWIAIPSESSPDQSWSGADKRIRLYLVDVPATPQRASWGWISLSRLELCVL